MFGYGGAHSKAKQAELKGLIVRPERCEACNEEKYLFKHHRNYNLPLAVTWLCNECHREEHRLHPERITPLMDKKKLSEFSMLKYNTEKGNDTLYKVRVAIQQLEWES